MVQEGRRRTRHRCLGCRRGHSNGRYLSFAEREEIALPSRSGLLHAGGRSPARASGIDNLQRAAAQRRHPEAAASRIVRRQRNGTPSALLAAQSRRSLRPQRGVKNLCRGTVGWRSLWLRAGLLFPARSCPGKAVGTDNTEGPAMGKRLEPGAVDHPSPAGGLRGRR